MYLDLTWKSCTFSVDQNNFMESIIEFHTNTMSFIIKICLNQIGLSFANLFCKNKLVDGL